MDELTTAEARALLAELPVGHVGVVAEGRPYVTPMSYVVVRDTVWFRTVAGRRLDAIRTSPVVSMAAARWDDSGHWDSVIVSGVARVVEDPNREADVVAALLHKYPEAEGSPLALSGPALERRYIVSLEIDEISARTSGGGLNPPTRPGRL